MIRGAVVLARAMRCTALPTTSDISSAKTRLDVDRHAAVISNIEFHAGRQWPLDLALWDLKGKIQGEPVWKMLGGFDNKIRAYASSGVHRSITDMVDVAKRARSLGFPALKGALRPPKVGRRFGSSESHQKRTGLKP